MGVIWYKIWYDLWSNKGRTLQVVLIIAMGAFAIGMIVTTRNLVIQAMADIWRDSSPAMIALSTSPSVDDDVVASLKRIDGIKDVEGYSTIGIEWRLHPDDRWSPGGLIARADYDDQRFTKLALTAGAWPQKKTVVMGQDNDTAFGIPLGGQIYIRVDDRERLVNVGGIVYDPVSQPPGFGGNAQFFATRDFFEELTGDRDFNRIMAGAWTYDEPAVLAMANEMQDKLERQDIDSAGATVFGERVADPTKHFFQDTMDGIFFILGLLAGLALILGLFLVYNTINAIVTQQVDQIGIMKAIGATTPEILLIYFVNVFVYGALALLIALPFGVAGGWLLTLFLVSSFNADPGPFTVSPPAVVAEVVIALLAPLVASLVPVLSGARITVREAISTYGLSAQPSLLDRFLARIQRISRLFLLTVSNTFRHKGRVILTQITLILSGLIFMMVVGVSDSVRYTYSDVIFSILRFNVSFVFEDPERTAHVEPLTLAYPDVKAVETWGLSSVDIRAADTPETDDDESAFVFGVPLPTTLYGPQVRAGRWLLPADIRAVVLNQELADDVGVGVGDWVTFDYGVRGETDWQVVGLVFDPIITTSAHVPREPLLEETGSAGRANTIWIQTTRTDPEGETATATGLRDFYEQHQVEVAPQGIFGQDTATGITAQAVNNFGIIISLLGTMAVVIGVVGSIALSGVLSLNVLERRREIGVMRAVGASSGDIARIFIGEGLILGLLSWGIAFPLSIPVARQMSQTLGAALGGELIYQFTLRGALYWLGIIIVLSVAASWFPARSAMRLSVRESLAYQ